MTDTFERIKRLVVEGAVRISEHGYDEIALEDISVRDILETIGNGLVIEDYPDFPKGPCVLVLQKDRNGNPLHVVWGIPKDHTTPAVVVTAYRPDLAKWEEGFMRRRK